MIISEAIFICVATPIKTTERALKGRARLNGFFEHTSHRPFGLLNFWKWIPILPWRTESGVVYETFLLLGAGGLCDLVFVGSPIPTSRRNSNNDRGIVFDLCVKLKHSQLKYPKDQKITCATISHLFCQSHISASTCRACRHHPCACYSL